MIPPIVFTRGGSGLHTIHSSFDHTAPVIHPKLHLDRVSRFSTIRTDGRTDRQTERTLKSAATRRPLPLMQTTLRRDLLTANSLSSTKAVSS